MIAKYKWYFIGAGVIVISAVAYFMFIKKDDKKGGKGNGKKNDENLVADEATSAKDKRQGIMQQDLDLILN